jgi:hypothetical protein
VVEFVNPIILSIDSRPALLLETISLSQSEDSNASKMGIIALLKCYKDLGKIVVDNSKRTFIHSDDVKIELSKK